MSSNKPITLVSDHMLELNALEGVAQGVPLW